MNLPFRKKSRLHSHEHCAMDHIHHERCGHDPEWERRMIEAEQIHLKRQKEIKEEREKEQGHPDIPFTPPPLNPDEEDPFR